MGTTNLNNLVEGLSLLVKGIAQFCQSRNQIVMNFRDGGNMHCGWEAANK